MALVLLGTLFGPSLLHLGDQLLGVEYVDHYGTQWFYWFVERQAGLILAGDPSAGAAGLGHTDLFFHPWGKDLFLHTGANYLDAFAALPFRWLFGSVAGYNLFVLTGLAATAWAFHSLARDFSDDPVALGVGTLLFVCTPYVLFELVEGRPTQGILLLPLLFLRYSLRTASQTGWKSPLMAGILLALCGYQYWFYAFFFGVAIFFYGGWRALHPLPEAGGGRNTLLRFTSAAVVALVLCSPVVLPMLVLAEQPGGVPGLLDTDAWSLAASPPLTMENQSVGLFLWQPLRQYAGFYVLDAQGGERYLESVALLPWLAIPLWIGLLVRPGRLDRAAVVCLLVPGLLLAMGPLFLVGQQAFPNPVYIFLAKALPFLRRLWWPYRAFSLLCVVLGLAVVWALDWLVKRGRGIQVGVAILLCGTWVHHLRGERLWPFPSWDASIPAGYQCLAEGEPGAILELPFSWTQGHLYYQTRHGRPIFGGMLENNAVFTPGEHQSFQADNLFVASLLSEARIENPTDTWDEADREALRLLGYKYVVLQKDALVLRKENLEQGGRGPSRMIRIAMKTRHREVEKRLKLMVGDPVYSDARISIYAPWGDPVPCELEGFDLDRVVVGHSEVSTASRLLDQPEAQALHRPWFGEDFRDAGE
jgi:hypothetical protein